MTAEDDGDSAMLNTILIRLTGLFLPGASGSQEAAHTAAIQTLHSYHPKNDEQLCLAAEIISFSFHTLQALDQAADPAVPVAQSLRLRSCAVSLSREAHRSRAKLEKMQRDHEAAAPPQTVAQTAEPTQQELAKAREIANFTRQALDGVNETIGAANSQTWTQAYHQRQTDKRLAARQHKNQPNQPAA